jgi:hypothetical protein
MSAAAAAAAAAARRAREEEEHMTGYTPSDLAGGWQFKIMRSSTGAFRHPERLREMLEQESRAGWVMVEKFDSQRVRLKRPGAASAGDAALGADPYRTTYGISDSKLVVIILGVVFSTVALAILIVTLAKHP